MEWNSYLKQLRTKLCPSDFICTVIITCMLVFVMMEGPYQLNDQLQSRSVLNILKLESKAWIFFICMLRYFYLEVYNIYTKVMIIAFVSKIAAVTI